MITLGLLAVLATLVFAYVFSARTERFAARHTRERVTARQYVDLALAQALETANIIGLMPYQGNPTRFHFIEYYHQGFRVKPFSPNVLMSLDTNASPKVDGAIFATAVTNLIPTTLLEEEREQTHPHWIPIQGVSETTGEATGTNGYISFAVFNCSGLLDANFVTSNQLDWLSRIAEPDITDLNLFLSDRARATATNGLVTQYLDLHDLRLRSRGLAEQPRNLHAWSYDPGPDVTVTNGYVYSNREVKLVPKFNVNSWTNGLPFDWDGRSVRTDPTDLTDHYHRSGGYFQETWLPEVTNRFAAVGLANPEALAWNLVNFMDPDRIPQGPDENHPYWQEPWPVEDVPLINEVAVGRVPLEMSDNKPNHYAPGVELWFPFATNRITADDGAQLVVAVYTNWPPSRWPEEDRKKWIEYDDYWTNNVIFPEKFFGDARFGFTFSNNIPSMAYGTDTEFLTFTLPPPYLSFPVAVTNAILNPDAADHSSYKPLVDSDPELLVRFNDSRGTNLDPPPRYELTEEMRYLPLGIASYSTYLPSNSPMQTIWVKTTITVTNTIHLLPRVKLGDNWVDEAAGYHPGDGSRLARTNLLVFTGTDAYGNAAEPSGYEVNDPRRNGRFEDWEYYEASSRRVPAWELDPGIETLPICSLNGTTNLIANPWHLPYGQGVPLTHFNRLLDRAGDIGYIQQPERFAGLQDHSRTLTNLWQSICLADPTALATNKAGFAFAAGSVLEFFTIRATNTPVRGLVHFSTTHTNVVEALAADLAVSGISNRTAYLDNKGVAWFTRAFFEAQEELYQTTPIGVGDLGFGFGASPEYRDASAIADDVLRWQGSLGNDQKEDLLRGLAERVSFRQHVFVICLAGRTVAPSGRETSLQRAVAIVLRDAYSGRWQVVSWQWLH